MMIGYSAIRKIHTKLHNKNYLKMQHAFIALHVIDLNCSTAIYWYPSKSGLKNTQKIYGTLKRFKQNSLYNVSNNHIMLISLAK